MAKGKWFELANSLTGNLANAAGSIDSAAGHIAHASDSLPKDFTVKGKLDIPAFKGMKNIGGFIIIGILLLVIWKHN